jgi:hypothetical protein
VEILFGALAGAIAAVPGALFAGIVQITYKRLRNGRLVRRGEPPIRDVLFAPLIPVHAIAGAIVGGIVVAARGGGWWPIGVLCGLGLPALGVVAWGVACVAQLRR